MVGDDNGSRVFLAFSAGEITREAVLHLRNARKRHDNASSQNYSQKRSPATLPTSATIPTAYRRRAFMITHRPFHGPGRDCAHSTPGQRAVVTGRGHDVNRPTGTGRQGQAINADAVGLAACDGRRRGVRPRLFFAPQRGALDQLNSCTSSLRRVTMAYDEPTD
jgi:hypothetical protein